jgi:starch synthase
LRIRAFSKKALDFAGIAPNHFHPGSPFEYWGQVNFMESFCIELADKVTTVSLTYSEEIRMDPRWAWDWKESWGIGEDLSGIVNGIDYEEWNPETDPSFRLTFQ